MLRGLLRFEKENNNLKKRKVQHVAKISCGNGVEGAGYEKKGKLKRDLLNMLHNFL